MPETIYHNNIYIVLTIPYFHLTLTCIYTYPYFNLNLTSTSFSSIERSSYFIFNFSDNTPPPPPSQHTPQIIIITTTITLHRFSSNNKPSKPTKHPPPPRRPADKGLLARLPVTAAGPRARDDRHRKGVVVIIKVVIAN